MIPSSEIVKDHARRILSELPLSDEDRAALWEEYYNAPDADVLARVLERVPSHIAEPLISAKRLTTPKGPILHPDHERAMAPVVAAIGHLATLDPQALETAESHPEVLRALITRKG